MHIFPCCMSPPDHQRATNHSQRTVVWLKSCKKSSVNTWTPIYGLNPNRFWVWWRVSSDVDSPLSGFVAFLRQVLTFSGKNKGNFTKAKFSFICKGRTSVIVSFFTTNPDYGPVPLKTCLNTEPDLVEISPSHRFFVCFKMHLSQKNTSFAQKPRVLGKTRLDQMFIHSLSQIKNVFVHLKCINRCYKINNASKISNFNWRTVTFWHLWSFSLKGPTGNAIFATRLVLLTRRCAQAVQVGGSWKRRHAIPTVCPRAAVRDEPAASSLLTGCLLVCFFVCC